ncbi:hypothetical protein [Pseudomonas tohonis]|uniref:hypothetical protein n=1 Tax=Pseudomonas tohonis TaxID=2725477 RepID=UPI001F24A599|nr:hypothetical protein [Pseudomonas tohonis]
MRMAFFSGLMLLAGAAVAAPSAEQDAFKVYLLSGKESKVKDATWMTDTNLYVAVMDEGSRRDGFAEYLCMEAASQGVSPALIKVVDMAKVIRDKEFVELGKAYCAKPGEETEVKFY